MPSAGRPLYESRIKEYNYYRYVFDLGQIRIDMTRSFPTKVLTFVLTYLIDRPDQL